MERNPNMVPGDRAQAGGVVGKLGAILRRSDQCLTMVADAFPAKNVESPNGPLGGLRMGNPVDSKLKFLQARAAPAAA
jgi:hypothetical protein